MQRLGHISNAITSAILHQTQVSTLLDNCPTICPSCLEGKFTKLSFSYPTIKFVHHLEVIHNDIWRPASLLSLEDFM